MAYEDSELESWPTANQHDFLGIAMKVGTTVHPE
jgi:hypothetical protein